VLYYTLADVPSKTLFAGLSRVRVRPTDPFLSGAFCLLLNDFPPGTRVCSGGSWGCDVAPTSAEGRVSVGPLPFCIRASQTLLEAIYLNGSLPTVRGKRT